MNCATDRGFHRYLRSAGQRRAVALAWDGARHADQERRPSSAGAAVEPARRRRSLLKAAGLALGGVLYAAVVGYLIQLASGVLLEVLATRTRARIPPLEHVLARVTRTRTGRVGVLVTWAWGGAALLRPLTLPR